MYEKYGNENIFGRSDVEELTGLKSTRVSELLKMMLNANIIQTIKGMERENTVLANFNRKKYSSKCK